MKTVLTIAGFDPSSGAGVSADMMVFAAHGLFGISCITGLTVQSTIGVRNVYPVDEAILSETLACLEEDLPAAGIKIGMLGTTQAVEISAAFLKEMRERRGDIPVVLDPVLRSSSGRELLDIDAFEMLKAQLLPLVDWVTPNMEELGKLTTTLVEDRAQMETAALKLQRDVQDRSGQKINVLAKGGDLEVPDDLVMLSNGDSVWLKGERVETTATHGTGCALSSALICRLVAKRDPVEAAREAKHFVSEAMRRADRIGHGRGPMNLLWPLRA